MEGCYAPGKIQKCLAVIEALGSFYIVMTTTDAKANVTITTTPTFEKDIQALTSPPVGSTIYLKIILGEASEPKKWLEVLPVLKLQWVATMMIIQNPPGKGIAFRATNPVLRTQV